GGRGPGRLGPASRPAPASAPGPGRPPRAPRRRRWPRPRQPPSPAPGEQRNFTDPASRIMPSKAGWIQGYNAQVVVEAASGVIVAQEVSQHGGDSGPPGPVLGPQGGGRGSRHGPRGPPRSGEEPPELP